MRKNVVPCPKAAKSRMVPQSSCIRMNNERICTEQKNCTHFPCSFFHLNSHLGPHTPKILRTEKAPGLLCPEPISIPFLIPLPSFVLLTCIHYYLRSFLTSIIAGICISRVRSFVHCPFLHLPFLAFAFLASALSCIANSYIYHSRHLHFLHPLFSTLALHASAISCIYDFLYPLLPVLTISCIHCFLLSQFIVFLISFMLFSSC